MSEHMSEVARAEQEKAMAAKLANLAERGALTLSSRENWKKVRPGKEEDQPWTSEDRAGIVRVFMEELGGSTKVYAVYKEGPTVDHPAEEGERFTVDEYDLMTDDIPEHGGSSELSAVFASRQLAERYANEE